jgi:hypothetical protein
MNRHWTSTLISRAAAGLLLSLHAGPAAALTGPDAVTRWNDHLLAVTAPDPPAPYRPNPEIAVVAAYLHIAMYDAISSIDGDYTPFVRPVTNVPPGASREAAVIEAAYRMAICAYPPSLPNQPPSPFVALAAQFTGFYTTEMGAIPSSQAKTDGIASAWLPPTTSSRTVRATDFARMSCIRFRRSARACIRKRRIRTASLRRTWLRRHRG